MVSKKGEGTFSEVLKCQNTKDNTYWACKRLKQRFVSSEELKNIREIQALRHLNGCPHILQLYEVILLEMSFNSFLIKFILLMDSPSFYL